VAAQAPETQAVPWGQTLPQAPQLWASEAVVTQAAPASEPLPHWVVPEGQLETQLPDTQAEPEAQTFPQLPQFWLSEVALVQRSPQRICAAGQTTTQEPP
jgi:hypothetical protein